MILLLDIGNTHTHLGLADADGVRRQTNLKTALWQTGGVAKYPLQSVSRLALKTR